MSIKKINSILSKPMIITDKGEKIVDYNFFAEYTYKNLKENSNLNKFNNWKNDFKCVSMKHNNVYISTNDDFEDVFFKQILDNSFDEIFVADANGIAIYCNETFEKNYGVKREDLIGKHVNYVVDNNYVDILLFDKVVSEKKTITYKQKTITGRTILNTSSPILDEDGNIIYVIENCRDITENELLYNTLNHTKSQLNKELNIKSKMDSFKNNFSDFKSKSIREIIMKAKRFSNRDVNILITGQSGTGKTSLAKYIHENSIYKEHEFVTINCATIPENLLESELFGYKKGAFTGALNSGKKGLVEQAENGTLFLDEISEIPLNLQAKLLELVQEKQYLPIGSTNKKTANIRIIAATNKNLKELVDKKLFREDLYYRLNVVHVLMPPLSDRIEDIEILIEHFESYFNKKYDLNVSISKDVLNHLKSYSWPGNIRELEHLIEYLIINCRGKKVRTGDLPKNIVEETSDIEINNDCLPLDISGNSDYKSLIENAEYKIISAFYEKYRSSYKVAKALNISQSTASRMIKKYCK